MSAYLFYWRQGHGLLEMPSGTGKTITLLSFILSYQLVSRRERDAPSRLESDDDDDDDEQHHRFHNRHTRNAVPS